jgi:hypothetical protein
MPGEMRHFGELFAEPPRNGLTRPKAVRGAGVKMVIWVSFSPIPDSETPQWIASR